MGTALAVDESTEGAPEAVPGRWEAVRDWVVPAVLVVAAGVLSLPRLGSRSMWLDETYTVGATNQLFDTWRNTAGTQALYYLIVWPVSRLSTDPTWLRLPSALIGMAAVVVVYRIGLRVGTRIQAGLAAGGMALSWGLARYSVEARSYTLALLLVSLSWLALIAAIQADSESSSQRCWRIFYVVTLLVPLAHGLAVLNYAAQLAALVIAPTDKLRLLRRALPVAPGIGVVLGVLFLLGASDVGDWVPPLSLGQLREFRDLLLGFGAPGLMLAGLTALAIGLAVRSYLRERSLDNWIRLLPAFWALGPSLMVVGVSLVRPYAAARYVFPSLPGFFLLLAALLVTQLRSTRLVALAALLIVPVLLVDQRHVTTIGLEGWPEMTACMAANAEQGDRLVTAMAHRPALDYFWDDHPELARIEPLAPPESLGTVRRLYESLIETRSAFRSVLLEDSSESIWYVERTDAGIVSIAGLAFDEEVNEVFRLSGVWYFAGNLSLVRLDPIGSSRPTYDSSCSTVPTPPAAQPAEL